MSRLFQDSRNRRFLTLLTLVFLGFFSSFTMAGPVAYDFTAAAAMPADVVTIVSNSITLIYLLTGGMATLVALKGGVGLVSGLVMRMFS